jgi:hypothetical protein
MTAVAAGSGQATMYDLPESDVPTTDPMQPLVVPFSNRSPNVYTGASALAVAPDGRRAYVGLGARREPDRKNLGTLTLDANGQATSEAAWYPTSAAPLGNDTGSTVTSITINEAKHKLYVTSWDAFTSQPVNLTSYDLDASWAPIQPPRSYANDIPAAMATALHPSGKLYLVGQGYPGVVVFDLDGAGEPSGPPHAFPISGNGGFVSLAISPDGLRLYLGGYNTSLSVWSLDGASGYPAAGTQPQTFTPSVAISGGDGFLHLRYSPKAIYFGQASIEQGRQTLTSNPLVVWPLDAASGLPTGDPIVLSRYSVGDIAPDLIHNLLWVSLDSVATDAFDGSPRLTGTTPTALALDERGMPTQAVLAFPAAAGRTGVITAIGSSGRPAFLTEPIARTLFPTPNYQSNIFLRLTLLPTSGAVDGDVLTFDIGDKIKGTQKLTLGQPTPWIALDPVLKDLDAQIGALLTVASSPSPTFRADIARGDPANGGELIRSLTDSVAGQNIRLLLPGYAYEPASEWQSHIEWMSEHAQRYVAAAQGVALCEAERPRQLTVALDGLVGLQAHAGQLDAETSTAQLLGFNTTATDYWDGLPGPPIAALLQKKGLAAISYGVAGPPDWLDLDTAAMSPSKLDEQINYIMGPMVLAGGSPANMVLWEMGDEPRWYYPSQTIARVVNDPVALSSFHDYLAQQGFTCRTFDPSCDPQSETPWATVRPIGQSGAVSPETRRLFYWTVRFFNEQSVRSAAATQQAAQRAFGPAIPAFVDWNNWINHSYLPTPSPQDPDAAIGAPDWFATGRASAQTLWTEDYFGDQESERMSVLADVLRSASMSGTKGFGAYMHGLSFQTHPEAPSYRLLSFIGKGSKIADFWLFGPGLLIPNGWSEQFDNYGPFARAIRRIGRAERLLYPGVAARGRVAIQVPGLSRLWDHDGRQPYFDVEATSLQIALTHAGYTVDYVDDTDIATSQGDVLELTRRGYSVLYLTQPNLADAAQAAVRRWVDEGHVVVATPGAATANEYNEATTTLDPVLGLTARAAERSVGVSEGSPLINPPISDTLHVVDPAFGSTDIPLSGPVVPLIATTATVSAIGSKATPLITSNAYGAHNGRAVAYGFYPAWQYWESPNRKDPSHLPLNWDSATREVTAAPAAIAGTPRPVVVDQAGVEAMRLDSAQGIAVVLLNWTDQPIRSLHVTVPDAGRFTQVSSAETAQLVATQTSGGAVTATIAIANVDILMFEPAGTSTPPTCATP